MRLMTTQHYGHALIGMRGTYHALQTSGGPPLVNATNEPLLRMNERALQNNQIGIQMRVGH